MSVLVICEKPSQARTMIGAGKQASWTVPKEPVCRTQPSDRAVNSRVSAAVPLGEAKGRRLWSLGSRSIGFGFGFYSFLVAR